MLLIEYIIHPFSLQWPLFSACVESFPLEHQHLVESYSVLRHILRTGSIAVDCEHYTLGVGINVNIAGTWNEIPSGCGIFNVLFQGPNISIYFI